jgi:hypothetical protein
MRFNHSQEPHIPDAIFHFCFLPSGLTPPFPPILNP